MTTRQLITTLALMLPLAAAGKPDQAEDPRVTQSCSKLRGIAEDVAQLRYQGASQEEMLAEAQAMPEKAASAMIADVVRIAYNKLPETDNQAERERIIEAFSDKVHRSCRTSLREHYQ